jgi:mono/diheme cytochrome c family protein
MKHYLVTAASLALLGITIGAQAVGYGARSHQEPEWKAPKRSARKKSPLPDDAATVAKGKVVYDAQCVSCHGASGVGDGVAAKDLEKHPGDLTSPSVQAQSDGALFWKITTGRAPMTAFGDTLSVEQRWQVVRYVRTLTAKKLTVASPELEAPEALRAPLTRLQGPYDQLRQALAKGDQKAAAAAIPALGSAVEALGKVDVSKLKDPLSSSWKRTVDTLTKAVATLGGAKDVRGTRASFSEFSAAAEAAWARFGHTLKSPLLVFECSKATKAGSARWVQSTREPGNPYLGSKETSCVKLLRGIAATRPETHGTGGSK